MDVTIWSQLNLDWCCVVDGNLVLVAPICPNLDDNEYFPNFAHLMPNAVYTYQSVDLCQLVRLREQYNKAAFT